jgi:hypothetical protein
LGRSRHYQSCSVIEEEEEEEEEGGGGEGEGEGEEEVLMVQSKEKFKILGDEYYCRPFLIGKALEKFRSTEFRLTIDLSQTHFISLIQFKIFDNALESFCPELLV